MIKLTKDLGEKKDEIEHIRVLLGDKIATTQANQQFVKVGPNVQKYILNSMQMVSKIIEIIGNMIRYILIDIKTIENTTNKLLSKKKIKPDNAAVKKDKKEREKQKAKPADTTTTSDDNNPEGN